MFVAASPEDQSQHAKVIRGKSHNRPRPERAYRFANPIITHIMKDNKKVRGTDNRNWLGRTWAPDGNWNKFPTYDQVELGVLNGAKNYLKLQTGLPEGDPKLVDLQKNVCEIWKEIFDLVGSSVDRTSWLSFDILKQPNHPVTLICCYIYSMDTFISQSLTSACMARDEN